MVKEIEDYLPSLQGSGYQVTSPKDEAYNCIAWAAQETQRWWWPSPSGEAFWTEDVPREESVPSFEQALGTLGYEVCLSEEMEEGFEKIALFADAAGLPTHAARQLPSGRWSSKLGEREDIEHNLHDLSGEEYGSVVRVMRPRRN
jgi:hypothetical protein